MISLKSSNIIINKISFYTPKSPLQDSLNASSIRHALTVNPTIHTLCIKQFWATTKGKTVNGEVQIQALVDKKKVIITETRVRSDLRLEDAEEPITNEAANEEHVPTHSKDLLLSGEDKLQLKELLELCTKLSERVLDLENTKTSQAAELLINGENPLEDEGLGGQEDASKQDRKIDDLNADAEQELSMKRLNSKPKAVTTAATTTTTAVTRPKARGVVVQEPSKAKMIEPEKPLKKKDQILIDEEIAQKLQAQFKCQNWKRKNLQNQEKKMQTLLNGIIKKHFARLRAEEQRRKPPTKAQKRSQMCTYLKNMARFTYMVKGRKEKDEGSVTRAEESSSKRAGTELEQERIKKQNIDDDQEEAEMKKNMEIVVDEEEIAVDAIPLATKPPIIVDWKIIKEEKIGYFQLIRADGSSRRYSSMISMLQNIDREDLETLWKLVKAKHGNTRPDDAYERVLWGDLKVMFEPDIESDVWRNLQGYKVTV
ncbi:hypothetical protein Tco_0585211 [Tanacetum coccineum]